MNSGTIDILLQMFPYVRCCFLGNEAGRKRKRYWCCQCCNTIKQPKTHCFFKKSKIFLIGKECGMVSIDSNEKTGFYSAFSRGLTIV